MATSTIDFKVKNGIVVTTTATFLSTATSISTVTGALVISGGVGMAGSLNVGTNLSVTGIIAGNGANITNIQGSNIVGPISGTYAGTLTNTQIVTGLGYIPASLVSPAFTGTPTVATAVLNDNSTTIANTAFVARSMGILTNNILFAVNGTLSATQNGAFCEVNGTITLPLASTSQYYTYNLWSSGTYYLYPTSPNTFTLGGTALTALFVQAGCPLQLFCDGTTWIATQYSGVSMTAPLNDNTSRIANTSFVIANANCFPASGGNLVTTNTALSATSVGQWVTVLNSGVTVTLPDISLCPLGKTFSFMAQAATTIKGFSTQQIITVGGAAANTISLIAGQSIQVVSNGNGASWWVFNSGFDNTAIATLSSPTFTGVVTLPQGSIAPGLLGSTSPSVAAAGTNQATATALTSDINIVTSSLISGTSGVVVPGATSGKYAVIVNRSTYAILVYPSSGHQFDGLGTNTAITLPVNGMIEIFGSSTTQWHSTINAIINTSSLIGSLDGGSY